MGDKITLPIVEDFWDAFSKGTEFQWQGALANAKIYLPKAGAFAFMPRKWWGQEPWTAPNFAPEPEPQISSNEARYRRVRDQRKAEYEAEQAKQYAHHV